MRIQYLIFLFVLIACKKYSIKDGHNHLPRETEKGRGIFACYIDDGTYIARDQGEITYNKTTGYLFLENSNDSFEFRLFVYEGIFGTGNYIFDNTGEEFVLKTNAIKFGIKVGGINELEITELDLDYHTISGTFSIDLEDENGEQKIIRNGRFDLEIKVIG